MGDYNKGALCPFLIAILPIRQHGKNKHAQQGNRHRCQQCQRFQCYAEGSFQPGPFNTCHHRVNGTMGGPVGDHAAQGSRSPPSILHPPRKAVRLFHQLRQPRYPYHRRGSPPSEPYRETPAIEPAPEHRFKSMDHISPGADIGFRDGGEVSLQDAMHLL